MCIRDRATTTLDASEAFISRSRQACRCWWRQSGICSRTTRVQRHPSEQLRHRLDGEVILADRPITKEAEPMTGNDQPERELQVYHHAPADSADRFALGSVKFLRFLADSFFQRRYGHRAVILETVAAVPGICLLYTSPSPRDS